VEITGGRIGLPLLIHASRVESHRAKLIGWHSHDGFELLFLLQGATTYEFRNQQPIELRGGHFLVILPRLAHRGLHNVRSPSTICGLAINPDAARAGDRTTFTRGDLARLSATLRNSHREPHPFSPALRWLVGQLMAELCEHAARPIGVSGTAVRTLICAVLVEAERQMTAPAAAPGELATAAVAYLREHLRESIPMADLVRRLGFSRARMFELFKAQTGFTPNDYLQRLRVEKAREFLRQTSLSVTDIALETGFSSGQYFCTVFKRYTGQPPETFRTRSGVGSTDASRG
jgi:AraC-like DNA-binding protein